MSHIGAFWLSYFFAEDIENATPIYGREIFEKIPQILDFGSPCLDDGIYDARGM